MTTTTYTPKPIAGQTVKGYTKVNIAQIRKLYASGQTFNGFMVGNKVSSFHFFGGWTLACTVHPETIEEFERQHNEFCFYMDPELGSGAAFYLKK